MTIPHRAPSHKPALLLPERIQDIGTRTVAGKFVFVEYQITRKSGHSCDSLTCITWISCIITCITCTAEISHQLISWDNINITRILDYHWLSLIIIDYHWLSLSIMEYHRLSLIIIHFHWLLLIIIDYYWLSLIIIVYHWLSLIVIDYHWLSLIIIDYHWLSLIIWNSEKRWITDSLTDSLTDN